MIPFHPVRKAVRDFVRRKTFLPVCGPVRLNTSLRVAGVRSKVESANRHQESSSHRYLALSTFDLTQFQKEKPRIAARLF
jgi:hypothetical protein